MSKPYLEYKGGLWNKLIFEDPHPPNTPLCLPPQFRFGST